MLVEFVPKIWIAEGRVPNETIGFQIPHRMFVIRLSDGGLLLWSPISFTTDLSAEIDALGNVEHIIAPNLLHHLYVSDWQKAYPSASFHAAPGFSDKRPDIEVDFVLSSIPHRDWSDEIKQALVDSGRKGQGRELVFFHKPSNTAIFADLLCQIPENSHLGWRGLISRVRQSLGHAIRRRPSAACSTQQILEWPTANVLMARGATCTSHARRFLNHALG